MSKKKVYKRWWFWLIALIIVSGIISGGGKGSGTLKENNPKPVATEKKEKIKKEEVKKEEIKFDFTNAELNEENIKKALKDVIPYDLTKCTITNEDGKNIVDISYNPGTVWDEKGLVKDNAINATNAMEVLFKNVNVDKVWVWTETEMEDAKGNRSAEQVVNVALTKENAQDINWKNFKNKVILDYNALYDIADENFIHPGIAKNIKK